jgi:hypothetical protein
MQATVVDVVGIHMTYWRSLWNPLEHLFFKYEGLNHPWYTNRAETNSLTRPFLPTSRSIFPTPILKNTMHEYTDRTLHAYTILVVSRKLTLGLTLTFSSFSKINCGVIDGSASTKTVLDSTFVSTLCTPSTLLRIRLIAEAHPSLSSEWKRLSLSSNTDPRKRMTYVVGFLNLPWHAYCEFSLDHSANLLLAVKTENLQSAWDSGSAMQR